MHQVLHFSLNYFGLLTAFAVKEVEARGVEPLSSNRIRRPSTCLTALEI